jgi:HK97 family phage portal protein
MKFPRIFGRSEQKASATGAMMVMAPGEAVWSNRDYKAFADEAYRRNVVAYQAVNRIADAVASVRWTLWRGETEIIDHEVLKLLAKPNPMQSGAQYIQAKIGYLLLSGNGYEERVKVGQSVRELYQLRPDRMKVLPSNTGFPRGYVYEMAGRKHQWDMDEQTQDCDVRHIRMFNPLDDWYGLSPVEASAYSIDQHNEAMQWMQGLLQNGARPSGALVMAGEASMGDEAFNRLKAQMDEQYTGSKNAGRPMLLEGGLDWKEMGLSPTDMGIIEAKNAAARDIALGFGVPPQLLGIPGDNTYSNYQEARLAFWEDTVTPLVDWIASDWSEWLTGGELQVKPDMDQIPAIVEKRQTLWDMADKATDLTINERRELKGYKPVDGGDVLLVNSSQISLDTATEPPLPMPAPAPVVPSVPPELTPEDIKAWVYGAQTN